MAELWSVALGAANKGGAIVPARPRSGQAGGGVGNMLLQGGRQPAAAPPSVSGGAFENKPLKILVRLG